jgi:hypothetical protein
VKNADHLVEAPSARRIHPAVLHWKMTCAMVELLPGSGFFVTGTWKPRLNPAKIPASGLECV